MKKKIFSLLLMISMLMSMFIIVPKGDIKRGFGKCTYSKL